MGVAPLLATQSLDIKIRIAAVIATAVMLGVVLELVRRRRLAERYALLWMTVSVVLLVLAIWTGLLSVIADALGIQVPANALFIAAIAVAFLLLLHFSVISTRLSEQTKSLAQEVARLDSELRRAREGGGNGAQPAAEEPAPSSLSTTDQ
jgi:hypothetical protein